MKATVLAPIQYTAPSSNPSSPATENSVRRMSSAETKAVNATASGMVVFCQIQTSNPSEPSAIQVCVIEYITRLSM